MTAPDVRRKPDGDQAGVYVYVPRYDTPGGGWTCPTAAAAGPTDRRAAYTCVIVFVGGPDEYRVLNKQCPVHGEAVRR